MTKTPSDWIFVGFISYDTRDRKKGHTLRTHFPSQFTLTSPNHSSKFGRVLHSEHYVAWIAVIVVCIYCVVGGDVVPLVEHVVDIKCQ